MADFARGSDQKTQKIAVRLRVTPPFAVDGRFIYTIGDFGTGRCSRLRRDEKGIVMLESINARLRSTFTSDQFTYEELRSMFFTLVMDQFFIVFISILSTAMVSSTGEAAIAATSMVGSINSLVVLVFTALAVGGSIVIARAKGLGDLHGIRHAIGGTIALCGATSIVLSTLLFALSRGLVNGLYPNAEPLLIGYSIHYMRLMCISFVPYAIFNAVFNAFRSVGDTRSSLALTIVINGVHLICSFIFIFINLLHLGVTGAGLFYIVACTTGAVVALLWLLVIHNEFFVRVRHLFHRPLHRFALPSAALMLIPASPAASPWAAPCP